MKRVRSLIALLIITLACAGQQQTYAQQSRQRSRTTTTQTKRTTTGKTTQKAKTQTKTQPKTQAQPKTRSAESIRSEQDATNRRISETSNKINITGAKLKRQLNTLNSLNADITRQQATVNSMRERIDSLHSAIGTTSDTIAALERQLTDMRNAYAHALRQIQPSASKMNVISFIFSASSFSEAYNRVRYLNRFSQWRRDKALEIEKALDRVARRRQHLTVLQNAQDKAYRDARDAERTLTQKQNESRRLVDDLRRQDTQLRAELARQKKQAQALDRELDRIIAAEQARIAREEAERKRAEKNSAKGGSGKTPAGGSSGSSDPSARDIASARATEKVAASTKASDLDGSSFVANKGRMLFPVAGRYKIVRPFGRQPHPTQRNVMTDNSGIDIEVSPSTQARAVFAGTVSAIFHQDGFQNIVMLRHGSHLTIYAGLATTNVRVGQKVSTGQTLGTIYSDPADSDRTILHFEVRNERTKLNPTQWVH